VKRETHSQQLSNFIPSVATAGCSSDVHYTRHKKCFKKMYIIHKRTHSDRHSINNCSQTKHYSCNVHLMVAVWVIKYTTQRWGEGPPPPPPFFIVEEVRVMRQMLSDVCWCQQSFQITTPETTSVGHMFLIQKLHLCGTRITALA